MKRILLTFLIGVTAISIMAQPPRRKVRNNNESETSKSQTSQTPSLSSRASMDFPTAAPMPEDVTWKRDFYRSLDLTADKNAVLYYPQEPQGDKMNLFTYLFKLVLRKQINAYEYTIDGNEDFRESNIIKPKDMLERFRIPYQTNGDKIRVDDSDIPSSGVTMYYIKESTYYNQHTATFHTQISAICPVLKTVGEWGGEATPTPLFWIKYSDVAAHLTKLSLMGSNYNNAAVISADDYFTTNQYEGKIYKTNNLQGKVLANYCNNDTALNKEQKRIEKEISTFEKHVWKGDSIAAARADSLAAIADSIAVAKAGAVKSVQKPKVKSEKVNKTSTSTSSRSQTKREKSVSTGPKFSTRRQRH